MFRHSKPVGPWQRSRPRPTRFPGARLDERWTGFLTAAQEIAAHGTFNALRAAIGGADLNARF
jgi:hypothetical protein